MPGNNASISRIHLRNSGGQVVFGDVTYRPRSDCGPRVQEDYQLVLLYTGHADVHLDDAAAPLHIAPGHAALLRPGRREYFAFTPDGLTHHGWCSVRPALVDEALAAEITRHAETVPISPRLATLVRLGLTAGSTRSEAANRFVAQLGVTILLEFLATAEGLAPAVPAALQRACACIDTRFAEPLALADLARTACVTPAHLIRLFHRHLGTTPGRALWRARVEGAARLLRETGLSLAEIAERTGFQNPFHLSRQIKKSYGLPPREYRRRAWNTPAD